MAKAKDILSKKIPRIAYRSKRARRSKEIIRIAAQLFSEKSYHDVTIDEIAAKVGVAKGTIYLYFKSKERLYLEILENGFEAIESLIEKEIAKSDPAPEKLKKVLMLIFGFYRQNLDVLRILSRDETHLIREHYRFTEQWRHRRVKLYEKILEKGVKEGSF
ncbi:MAG TPA: TetR/AcrR family transcriptional regulator, partial [Bacteroidia bacterium]|nr:TetR/AcrR family transcriptional regulator [Bacteroidia bacterium]